ncbi:hypothetical protein ABVT39_000142 [Epinephelus coioides]
MHERGQEDSSLASPNHTDPENRSRTYSGKDPFTKNLTITHCAVHRRQWESNKVEDSVATSSNRSGPQQGPKPLSSKSERFLGEPPLAKFIHIFLGGCSACHTADD